MSADELVKKVLNAYGGEDRWRRARRLRARISAKGLAFSLKRRPHFENARFEARVHEPQASICPIGNDPNTVGELAGHDDVRIVSESGEEQERRSDIRGEFLRPGIHWLFWNDLQMAYFANYATWNYLTFPALLLRSDMEWIEVGDHMLRGVFPSNVPTHCREQTFHIDPESSLLLQHDYTPEIISRFGAAANVIAEHKYTSDGVAWTAHRVVTPLKPNGQPANWPVLIDLRISDFELLDD